jgi:hypothetical protein
VRKAAQNVTPAAVIKSPSFRVCTADQIRQTPLRAAYRPSEANGTKGFVNAIGWLSGGIGIGVLALFAFVAVNNDPVATAGQPSRSVAAIAAPKRAVTEIDVKPAVDQASALPTDFEIPDDQPARAPVTARAPKRRTLSVRTAPF